MNNITHVLVVSVFAVVCVAEARELVVSLGQGAEFGTIQEAADAAMPGDVVTIKGGIYRESVNPPRGGESDSKRITYRAAPGEKVVVTGSEIVAGWTKNDDGIWTVRIPVERFGSFNPFTAPKIGGNFMFENNFVQSRASLYVNGERFPLYRDAKGEVVLLPKEGGEKLKWWAGCDEKDVAIFAAFPDGFDPNDGSVETTFRELCFYPSKTGCDYITLSGLAFCNAAPQWAGPHQEQFGMVGSHWSKGWIIENCEVFNSTCAGITLGKYGDEFDSLKGDSQDYVEYIERAVTNGWDKVGRHVVRDCVIHDCGQAGICGSLGAPFSRFERNRIYTIGRNQTFRGWEMACIKIHGAVDCLVEDNICVDSGMHGVWLDWMAQGTRVKGNVFADNWEDFYVEVSHGPVLAEGNLFLSNLVDCHSQGVAYIHNIFLGKMESRNGDERKTPYFKPHSLEIVNMLTPNEGGDLRIMGNLFVGTPESIVKGGALESKIEGNAFIPKGSIKATLGEKGKVVLRFADGAKNMPEVKTVTGADLGKTVRSSQAFPEPTTAFRRTWIKAMRLAR